MKTTEEIQRPSKEERKTAIASYNALEAVLSKLKSENTEIEIEETKEKIILPARALKLLGDILKAMGEGTPISLVPIATEVTTQKAADMLGCSRPHLVSLLESGQISFTKIGKHRRIKFEDVVNYKRKMKDQQKQHLIDLMNFDEEIGLYDT